MEYARMVQQETQNGMREDEAPKAEHVLPADGGPAALFAAGVAGLVGSVSIVLGVWGTALSMLANRVGELSSAESQLSAVELGEHLNAALARNEFAVSPDVRQALQGQLVAAFEPPPKDSKDPAGPLSAQLSPNPLDTEPGGFSPSPWDLGILAAGAAIAATVTAPHGVPSNYFGWHPVFMSLGFGLFMTGGRRVYRLELPGAPDKMERRKIHTGVMGTVALLVGIGYSMIFLAHLPKLQFFGFDFMKGEWKAPLRIVHVVLGYMAVGLVIFQAAIGVQKIQSPVPIKKFHGDVGKATHSLGLLALGIGPYLMKWSGPEKNIVAAAVAATLALSWAAPQPEIPPAKEDNAATDRVQM